MTMTDKENNNNNNNYSKPLVTNWDKPQKLLPFKPLNLNKYDLSCITDPEDLKTIDQLIRQRDEIAKDIEKLRNQKEIMLKELQEIQRQRNHSVHYIDYGLGSVWDVKDSALLDKEIARCRNHPKRAEEYEKKLMRVHNDQTAYFEWAKGVKFEPLEQTDLKWDLVVNGGLARIALYIAGRSDVLFNVGASGTGTSPESHGDFKLSAENWRVSLQTNGFLEPIGTAIKITMKFPSYINSAIITEMGGFDSIAPNSGTMFFRTLYKGSSRMEHLQNRTTYTHFQNIMQSSISNVV